MHGIVPANFLHTNCANGLYFSHGLAARAVSGSGLVLAPGSYQYPFSIQLPVAAPDSFESHMGRVRYYVKAVLERSWRSDHVVKKFITVLNKLDLNSTANAKVKVITLHSTVCE